MHKLMLKLAFVLLLTMLATPSSTAQRRRPCCTFSLPTWNGSFTYQGTTYPYTMIGGDPANGGTTYTSVMIVPIDLQFVDNNGTLISELNINTTMCNSASTGVSLTLNSPLFQNYPFYAGGTYLGTTQYTDAFQRANFWSQTSTNDYHVLLGGVTVSPAQPVIIHPANGHATPTPSGCTAAGEVGYSYFDTIARNLMTSMVIPDFVLPIFLVRNTLFDGNAGWHGSNGSATYIVASFGEPESLPGVYQDTYFLSHELAEWLDDPYGDNRTPPWKGGQAVFCQSNLEVGDPVTGKGFTAVQNGFTYHLTDLAFVSWFARQAPSTTTVNGWYTLTGNSYISPAQPCP